MRVYRSGQRWAFWRWTETPSGYLTRLHLIGTPFGSIMLHWIHKPDPEPHLHDHPVAFLSIVLSGGYWELRWRGAMHGHQGYNRGDVNTMPLIDRHRITAVAPRTLTLVLAGPKRQEWGFYTKEGKVHWKDYPQHTR